MAPAARPVMIARRLSVMSFMVTSSIARAGSASPQVLRREGDLEGELGADVVALVAVIVGAAAPQHLEAGEQPRIGRPQQVGRGIFAFVEGGAVLEVGVVDLGEAVADRRGPVRGPLQVDI